ncbi:MAG: nicotinate (nicotinamide) nucleotide adenylyltransferase [Clostridiales bacterium]|nr:nicotinate (nicotinamide) nucleotide adenylyltransferase [Clostridiales bacterium]
MKNKITKIAIFGGSFDPPHYGHVDIVKNLERYFDRVIVMPSYISPFKPEQQGDTTRFALCKKIFSSLKTEVSRYEISKKGVSYSVETAAYFAKRVEGQLYWVIGSEELGRLTEWHDIDKLKTLVTFYVVNRPNYKPDDDTLKTLKKRKIKIKLAPFVGMDVSSTEAKIDIAFGRPNKYLPTAVFDAVLKHGTFNPYGKYVQALYRYGLPSKRIRHIYGSAVRGMELAKLYGASVNDAVIACILHDVAKNEDPNKYADKIDISEYPEDTVHAPIGAYIAQQEFDVSDEIAHAIRLHSMADENMSLLDEIVYLADKTERGRAYKTLDYVRYLCEYDRSLAMQYALNEINSLEWAEHNEFSLRAINYYEHICHGKEYPAAPEYAPTVEIPLPEYDMEQEPQQEVPTAPEKVIKQFVPSGDEIKDIATVAAVELSLHKARNVDIVSLNGKTIVADYFVIASASSSTAVKALMGYVEDKLTKQFGINPNKRDVNAEWIALDYGGVIIHIFTDKMREFYNIERLWSDGHNVERYED